MQGRYKRAWHRRGMNASEILAAPLKPLDQANRRAS